MTIMGLRMFLACLEERRPHWFYRDYEHRMRPGDRRHEGAIASLVYLGCTRFLHKYGRGHFVDATVRDDLRMMQSYGNGCVQSLMDQSPNPPGADPSVFVATLRIVLLALELQQPSSRL